LTMEVSAKVRAERSTGVFNPIPSCACHHSLTSCSGSFSSIYIHKQQQQQQQQQQ
jgi:hypothetical protein